MRIEYARSAQLELDLIWDWNDERYGAVHADGYLKFLQSGIEALGVEPTLGRPVEGRVGVRALILRQSPQGHGHVVVYRVNPEQQAVRVLHVYHTAQDWRGRFDAESLR